VVTLVLGSADCLWPDVERSRALIGDRPFRTVACNAAAQEWPERLDHFATMHPEEMHLWLGERERRGYPGGFETWTRPYPYGMKHREKLCDHAIAGWAGSSGLLALGVAIETGGRRNILCGVPMDTRKHFNAGEWNAAEEYRERWTELADTLRLTTRSWSGWTRDLLGEPTAKWLDSEDVLLRR
jgi:hypothetical protein